MVDPLADFPQLAEARDCWKRGERGAALQTFERALAAELGNVRAKVEAAGALGQCFQIARAEALLAEADQLAAGEPRVLAAMAESYRLAYRIPMGPMIYQTCFI